MIYSKFRLYRLVIMSMIVENQSFQNMVLLIRMGHIILSRIESQWIIFLIVITHLSPDDWSSILVAFYLLTNLLVPFLPLFFWVKTLVKSVILLGREHYFFICFNYKSQLLYPNLRSVTLENLQPKEYKEETFRSITINI